MKKILGLTVAMILFTGMAGIGTWAYFSDAEASTPNILTAGTLDLKTDNVDGVTQTLLATSMGPGNTTGIQTIALKNNGSTAGTSLDLSFSYVETDVGVDLPNMTAMQTASMLEVTTLSYNSLDLLSSITADNGNGYPDIDDLSNSNMGGQLGISPGGSKPFSIGVTLRPETGTDYQEDGITVTMTFLLNE